MGILCFQKLQTDEVVGGSIKIQMMDKIRDWKTTHPEQQAVVVIRLKELLLSVVQLSVKAAFYGGSHRYYHERLDKFFQHFRDLNVKLVFFGGGTKTNNKLSKMTTKTDQEYRKYSLLLKYIDQENKVKLCARPEIRTCLGLYEEGIARKFGEYRLSTGSLNKDIVQYCRANENVIAILAKDSDFLLYSFEPFEYWSCGIEDLNFRDMTTVSYNHTAMLEHLNLTAYQFHVLIAIAGVILDDSKTHCCQVKKGIFKVKNPGSIQIIRSISDCVRNNVLKPDGKPDFGTWTTMTFTSRLEEYCWLIEKQFKKYEISTIATGTADDDTNVWKKYKNIWSIWTDEVIRFNFNFIDISRWNDNRNAMAYHHLFVLVLKRAMGIVMYSKRDENPKRRVLMKGHEYAKCKILQKTLTFPSFEIPTIEKLINETSGDDELITEKWSLLFWVLHLNFDDDVKLKIRHEVPREMLPVVVTVLFLLWEHQITPLEGDAIIISENNILNHPPACEQVDYPTKSDGRTIRIAHIYVHTRVLINRCFQICGLDLFNVPVLFDGVQFHNLMNEFVENLDSFENRKAEIKGFEVGAF